MTLNLSLSSETNDYFEVLLFRVQITHVLSNTRHKIRFHTQSARVFHEPSLVFLDH
jgi:hypothetical protein